MLIKKNKIKKKYIDTECYLDLAPFKNESVFEFRRQSRCITFSVTV